MFFAKWASLDPAAVWLWLTRGLGVLAIFLTLLPMLRTGKWFVRAWDFPRIHIAAALALSFTAAYLCTIYLPQTTEPFLWLSALGLSFVWQMSHIIVFTPVWRTEVAAASTNASHHAIMTVNLKYTNSQYLRVAAQIREINPDVLVLVEIDQRWHEGLKNLSLLYPYQHSEIRGQGTGIAVWSKLKIQCSETEFLVERNRPSIWATILIHQQTVRFVAVHPTPPGLSAAQDRSRRDSRTRDAELILIAKTIAENPQQAWIVAGDFNDVAWSHTTRLFKRTSGLKDPRIGRTYMGTFHSSYPLIRFPIDHVFLSDGFSIHSLSRQLISGSDHFAVTAIVSLERSQRGVDPEPQDDDQQDAQEVIEEGKADAERRGISAESRHDDPHNHGQF